MHSPLYKNVCPTTNVAVYSRLEQLILFTAIAYEEWDSESSSCVISILNDGCGVGVGIVIAADI
jgi:hypothetical protein